MELLPIVCRQLDSAAANSLRCRAYTPVANHAPHPPFVAGAERTAQPTRRPILIVEDDGGMRQMLQIFLEDASYAVCVARHGAEALDVLPKIQPRLILLDLRMPIMDGLTFVQRLRAQPEMPQPPIIVMTAYREITPDMRQYDFPAITKPMNLDYLLELIVRYAEPE